MYTIKKCPNSTVVYGPIARGCVEEICRCTSHKHEEKAQEICDLLNNNYKEVLLNILVPTNFISLTAARDYIEECLGVGNYTCSSSTQKPADTTDQQS